MGYRCPNLRSLEGSQELGEGNRDGNDQDSKQSAADQDASLLNHADLPYQNAAQNLALKSKSNNGARVSRSGLETDQGADGDAGFVNRPGFARSA